VSSVLVSLYALSNAAIRPSVRLSVCPIAQNVAFWGYGYYRTLIGSPAMLEVKPTVSVATRPPEVAKTAGHIVLTPSGRYLSINCHSGTVSGTRKFDRRLGQILHDQLHWLDVSDRVLFKLAVTVHQCLNGRAPTYLSEHCIPVSSADTRRHLRSANRHLLAVPRFRLNTYGRRAFSVAGPMAWNSLPDFIRYPTSSTGCFRRLLKTYLFARYWCIQRIRRS